MSDRFLLPITYSGFIDWYNRRRKKYSGMDFIPVPNDSGGEKRPEGEWMERMMEIIPEYDEDFQVIIALISSEREKKFQKNEDDTYAPYFQRLDILSRTAKEHYEVAAM